MDLRYLIAAIICAIVIGGFCPAKLAMAESCSTSKETEQEMLETAINLAKENPDVELVKDLLTSKHEDIKLQSLKVTCSYILYQVTVNGSSFVVKNLKKDKIYDAKEKERLSLEAKHLTTLQNLYPGLVPVLYCWSDKYSCMALEDLSLFSSLDSELKSGNISDSAIIKVAETVARLHKATHINTHPDVFHDVEEKFKNNVDSVDHFISEILTVDLEHLEKGRFKDAAVQFLTSDQTKATFASFADNSKTKKQALLHGQLFGKSILIKEDSIKFVNNDKVFVGPCAFDLGRLLGQYLSSYYEHMLTEENNDWHRKIMYRMVDAASRTMEEYLTVMGDALKERDEFISDVAAFGGLELINRSLKSIPEKSKALEVLQSGIRLFGARGRIQEPGRLVVIALMLAT